MSYPLNLSDDEKLELFKFIDYFGNSDYLLSNPHMRMCLFSVKEKLEKLITKIKDKNM
jgi:hypothetical protein